MKARQIKIQEVNKLSKAQESPEIYMLHKSPQNYINMKHCNRERIKFLPNQLCIIVDLSIHKSHVLGDTK